jgi:hypothetical protein
LPARPEASAQLTAGNPACFPSAFQTSWNSGSCSVPLCSCSMLNTASVDALSVKRQRMLQANRRV